MNIISYSLWGSNPKYVIGAIKNADLAEKYYPDWICYFHCASCVPKNILEQLSQRKNVKIINYEEIGDWKFTTKRFLTISDKDVKRIICRDTDSRISDREVCAVQKWIESDLDAHIMRDHPYHGNFPILAGMFGIKGGIFKNITKLLALNETIPVQYHYDQIFLKNYIFPYIQDSVLIHDEYFSKNPFPTKRKNKEYVGKPYNEKDEPDLIIDRE